MLRAIATIATVLVAAVACTGGDEGFDYGPHEIAVRALRKKVKATRCDGSAVFELADVMRRAGDAPGAAAELVAFRTECKSQAHLKLEAEVQQEAKGFAGMLEAASLLVEKDPSDPDLRTLRAKAHEGLGNLAEAARDHRQAFALRPRDPNASKQLALTLEQLDRPCEAVAAWAQLARWNRERRAEGQSGIHKLLSANKCPAFYPTGSAELDALTTPTGGWFVFPATVNGEHEALLGVDSSAPYTLLTPALVQKLGAKPADDELYVRTFVGSVRGQPLTLASVKLGELEVKIVEAVLVDQLPDGLAGMLGGDFLERVELDAIRLDDGTANKLRRAGKAGTRYRFAAKSSVAALVAPATGAPATAP